MVSTLPYISREELDELETELRNTKPGWSPDIDALQITILLDMIAAFRQGALGVVVDHALNTTPVVDQKPANPSDNAAGVLGTDGGKQK